MREVTQRNREFVTFRTRSLNGERIPPCGRTKTLGHCVFILIALLAFSASAMAQDGTRATISTKEGGIVEGRLLNMTLDEIVIDVAGQPLRLPVKNLKYVSFDGRLAVLTPKDANNSMRGIDRALEALKAVRAATEVGVMREQYSNKLLETLPKVNEFINEPATEWRDVRLAMKKAARLYTSVLGGDTIGNISSAWKYAEVTWAEASRAAEYAAVLATQPAEETHIERPQQVQISLGESIKGRLGFGDTLMPRTLDSSSAAGYNDVYRLELISQTGFEVLMDADGLACIPHLTLADERGAKIQGDRGGPTFGAKISRKLPPGIYSIWAGSFAEEVCAYTVRLTLK